jgi:chromosome segregation protein
MTTMTKIEESLTTDTSGSANHTDGLPLRSGLALTKLTLSGFKSFADKTTFTFDDPITGIVGPNGCGKSNVVDAIKWVLGERSSKSLRGKEMLDCIFAGSAGRKPSGMASVTLSFDNPKSAQILTEAAGKVDEQTTPTDTHDVLVEDVEVESVESVEDQDIEQTAEHHPAHDEHISDEDADRAASEGESEAASIITERRRIARPLPIDADQVEVQRRLYRDGKSQYLINGKLARLKDIRDLFLDTGIGADAYSIIEQGKVDRMLLASPMERRVIFEEAAGIAKYRQRRVEAQRKLDKAESNLAVTKEQLDSTERRLRMVKGQAAKARRFKELDDEYRAQRLALSFEQYDDIRRRLEGLTSQIASLETERLQTQQMLEEAEDQHNEAKEHRLTVGRALRETENALTNARHQAESANQRQEMTHKAIEDAAHLVETETTRLTESSGRLQEIDAQLTSHNDTLEGLKETLATSETTLSQTSGEREHASRQLNEHRQKIDETRSVVVSVEREHATLNARIESDDRRIESITERVSELNQRLRNLDAQISESKQLASKTEEAIRLIDQGIEKDQAALAALDQRVESLDSSRGDLAKRVNTLDEERVRLETRHATLDEMVKGRVGLDEAVRAVLEIQERGEGFSGVLGPLAELIEANADQASHIEAALEDTLQALVVESMDAMPTRQELDMLPGRVTFLPLSTTTKPTPSIPGWLTDATNGRVTRLRNAVTSRNQDPRVESLLDRLLGSSLLVSDLDSAMLLGAGPLASTPCRFVTQTGVVIEPDGRVCAGTHSGSESDGLLARQSELQELASKINTIRADLGQAKDNLQRVDQDAANLGEQRSHLHTKLTALRESRVRTEHTLDTHRSESDRLTRDQQRGIDEQHTHAARLEESRVGREALTTKAGQLERLLEEQREALEALQPGIAQYESALEDVNERASAARIAVSTAHEQVRSESRHLSALTSSRDEIERASSQAQAMIERARANLDEHKLVAQEAHDEQLKAHALIESLESAMHDQAEVVRVAEEAVNAASSAMTQARDQAEAFNRDWHAVESARRETEVKRETIEERTLEDLEVDLVFEYPEYRHMMDDGGITRIDVTAMTASVHVLKTEIKKLGNVNLNSIDEESNLTQRNEDLISQVRDIDEARIKLATLIEKLNVASRARFGEVFDRIKDEFGGRNGMFRRLFGGGRAEVRLMPLIKEVDGEKVQTDEIDLLESGIEVIAKPPGKEPRSINQLSGGEKTMTAVAMLLAIFRSKPSCFCVLDEVDAALDEANVGRFCSTLDLFALQSRFIVITHNKRTMQATNKLFGVTMQERGVSKRVEVRFDQVGEDGEIDSKAVKDAPVEAVETNPIETETPEGKKPSGALRAALASMRESDNPVEA